MNQEDKHIIDDLQVNPIHIPSDLYFEELKKNILTEVRNNSLKEEGALLPKTEASPGKDEKQKEQPGIISMYRRWYVWGSAAAILAFALLFPWNNHTSPSTNPEPINLSSVSNEEIYQYLDENIEDLDTEVIAAHLSKDEMVNSEITENRDEASATENTDNFTSRSPLLEHIKDEEILDYLNDESGELDEYLLIES
ncbi:hypothetical protein [uncultured Fluviicola sp.]|uniref:hypothetical protein n=1 Tax=uncultured Fluviicola sp. TaxID=463303 RepID=UPI0025D9018F|nr:hypothetical protein [uncultured Fluviicola sp.]